MFVSISYVGVALVRSGCLGYRFYGGVSSIVILICLNFGFHLSVLFYIQSLSLLFGL